MSHWFLCSVDVLEVPLRLVGSQFLDESQIQWSSADTGAEACHARSPTKVYEKCPGYSTCGPSCRCQAPVASESLQEICNLVPDAKGGVLSGQRARVTESRGAGTTNCASTRPARWQRGGQRNRRRKRAITCAEVHQGGFWTTTPPLVHAGRPFHVSPGAKSCEDTRSTTGSSKTLGAFLKFVEERALPLVEDVEVDGALVAYSNDCFVQGVQQHHGSQLLAAVMNRWPSFSRFGSTTSEVPPTFEEVATAHTCSHPTNNACTSLGRHCNTTHPHQSPRVVALYMRPSEPLASTKKDRVPPLP